MQDFLISLWSYRKFYHLELRKSAGWPLYMHCPAAVSPVSQPNVLVKLGDDYIGSIIAANSR